MKISQKYLGVVAVIVAALRSHAVRLIALVLFTNFTYTPVAQAQQLGSTWSGNPTVARTQDSSPSYYRQKAIHNPDGIGKYYMSREIAGVMGHQAMMWLERSSRVTEENPDLTVEQLELKNDDVVADIGAGSGYFSFRIAQKVPEGKVYAVDIQPEMLNAIDAKLAEDAALSKSENNITNIETVLGQEDNPSLPNESIDLAFMVDAYHEFAYPREMMEGVVQALKPGGRVVLLEYRQENPMIMIKPLHKMTEK